MGDRHKRRHDSDEEEDFIGFDDSDGGELQDSSFYNKRVRKVSKRGKMAPGGIIKLADGPQLFAPDLFDMLMVHSF